MSTLGIVITYRETELCKKAIKSLVNSGVDVALVFNGWDEKYRKWLEKMEDHIDFKFLNRENVGFCRGNNMAMRLAMKNGYDYVFLLNNDAYVKQDCIEELVKVMRKDEKIGMIQPKVYKAWNKDMLDTTGHIFRYGNKYSWENGLGYVIDRGQGEVDEGQYDDLVDVLGCCACAVLYRVRMLEEIGLFWEKLWSQGEDIELSWRAYKHGWKAKFVPEAIAYHWRGYSTQSYENDKEINKLWELIGYRNWTLTLRKYGNRKQRMFTSVMWVYVGCKSWVGKRIGRNDIGSYYIWLCGLALIDDRFFEKMEKEFREMFKKVVGVDLV